MDGENDRVCLKDEGYQVGLRFDCMDSNSLTLTVNGIYSNSLTQSVNGIGAGWKHLLYCTILKIV